ncbi:MAG: DJ-1/PfpI family protein [Candidatus Aadella gelida]|nr:DJ-1/PfpI family protein [Candidatus Aadella gelida]
MKKKVLVVIAEGFEEVEGIASIDVLRRSDIEVTVAGLGSKSINGARNVSIECDIEFKDRESVYDAIVLPGGMPGAENLAKSKELGDLLLEMISQKKIVAAICASPAIVLAPMGILDGRKATCYPGMEKSFSSKITFVDENVVQDGNLITSKGVGTALQFALKISENIVGKLKSEMIGNQVLVK